MTTEIPTVAIPEAWTAALEQWSIPDADTMLAAYLDPAHPVHTVAVDPDAPGVARFVELLHAALAGPARSAVVTYPEHAVVTVAALLVGESLGGVRRTAELPLVGPIEVDAKSTVIRSGVESRLEFQSGMRPTYANPSPWHTDCGPWRVPCRWAVLGATHCDPRYADAPTDVEPLWRLLDTWTEDPAHLWVLRETAVDWRQIFGGIDALRAPVLGESVLRWLDILLPGEFAAQDSPIGQACAAFGRHLARVEKPYQACLATGLLVMDNHEAIHRGPPIAEPELRRILKIKIGGLPD